MVDLPHSDPPTPGFEALERFDELALPELEEVAGELQRRLA